MGFGFAVSGWIVVLVQGMDSTETTAPALLWVMGLVISLTSLGLED